MNRPETPRSGARCSCAVTFVGLIYTAGASATVSDDALMYHLPIPAMWLRDHQLTFFATWFSNPANSYSPLAVETFITWLMAPVGNDLLAHFVQIPSLLLMYFACVQVLEGAGAARGIAAMVAVAALLSRPFVSQSILVKDDLFVAAFFMVIVAGCRKDLLKDRLGPWRVGIAAGLFFATKYIALQTAPLLLLLIDAPIRAGWKPRHWIIAIATMSVIAGPWYARNVLLTGNPLYPVPLTIGGVQIFKGLFFPSPSEQMHTLSGMWKTLSGGYQGLAGPLVGVVIVGAIASMGIFATRLLREPLVRMVAVGSVAGLLLFFFVSHAAEIRYVYPSLVLVFLACGMALSSIHPRVLGTILAGLLALACVGSGFGASSLVVGFIISGILVAAGGIGFLRLPRRFQLGSIGVAALILLGWIYVFWNSTVSRARDTMWLSLSTSYTDLTPAWNAAFDVAPKGSAIAYTNLALIRPAMGFDYSHPIVYVPTRPGITRPDQLPSSNVHLSEPQFRPFMSGLLSENPDRTLWVQSLLASKAGSLIVGKTSYLAEPPEHTFAEQDPAHFQKVFDGPAATVYRIIP